MLDPKSRKHVLKSIGTKWRNFKHYLFRNYIEPFQKDPDANLQDPPLMYNFLTPDDWVVFVSQRQSKKWQVCKTCIVLIASFNKTKVCTCTYSTNTLIHIIQDKSKTLKAVRAQNTYNHRLSRKGYAGLVQELVCH